MNARGTQRLMLGAPNSPLTVALAAYTISGEVHLRSVLLGLSTGIALKIPKATGSGRSFWLVVSVVCTTSPYYVISTNPSTDIFQGSLGVNIDASTAESFKTASNSNTITLNGTTTGGVTIGDTIQLQDILAGTWAVSGEIIGSGSVATPFSHV